jgi:hypothetical protein
MMKNPVNVTGRFRSSAVIALTLIVLSGSNVFAQGAQDKCVITTTIANDPTVLTFQPSKGTCLMAYDAFQSAGAVVLGRDLDLQSIVKYLSTKTAKGKYDSTFQEKFDSGMKFTDAMGFLKELLAVDKVEQDHVLFWAYVDVYGRGPEPFEKSIWEAKMQNQKAWYTIIVGDEGEKMNKNGSRPSMIGRAYNSAFGRDATAAEIAYYLPLKMRYSQIVEAGRSWLYSEKGTQELINATTKALTVTDKKIPTASEVKDSIAWFKSKNFIYAQMIDPYQNMKFPSMKVPSW